MHFESMSVKTLVVSLQTLLLMLLMLLLLILLQKPTLYSVNALKWKFID